MLFSNYSKLYYYFNFSYFLKVRVERFPSKKFTIFRKKNVSPSIGKSKLALWMSKRKIPFHVVSIRSSKVQVSRITSLLRHPSWLTHPLINPRNPSFTRFETPSNISFVLPPFLSNRDHRILLLVCSAVSTKDQGSFL